MKTAVSMLPMPFRSLAANSVRHAGKGAPRVGEAKRTKRWKWGFETQNWVLPCSGTSQGEFKALSGL